MVECSRSPASIRAPTDADPAPFLPSAYRDLDELDGFLEHLAREVYDRQLPRAARRAAGRPRAARGLAAGAVHAAAATTPTSAGCSSTPSRSRRSPTSCASCIPRLNSDLLLTAAIVHDLGRTREFTYGAEIGLTEEGRLLGHLVIGERILSERAGALDEQRRLALLHCVLCHHGPSAAPGGRFGSAEALALYRLNALDAAVKGALEQGFGPSRLSEV